MATTADTRSGRITGLDEQGVHVFRGIPFAAPPVGRLRFAAPQRETPWTGVRAATAFGPSAPQRAMRLPLPGMDVGEMDEDCLYLNVYTPGVDAGRRPVLVWIHGGGFVIGSGSQALYDAGPLARRGDVVVVTINYRLGPLGFLHLADTCPGLEGAVANAGLLDQIAALEWVRENISGFGGDPDCVTIFGESAGGMSVGTLLGMPGARGLFGRAIPQSGAASNVHTRDAAGEVAERYLSALGVDPSAAESLRQLPPDRLLAAQDQTVMGLGQGSSMLPFQPVVDGTTLPAPPLQAIRDGSAAGVDLMLGSTSDEWKLFGLILPSIAQIDGEGLLERVVEQVGDRDRAEGLVAIYRDAHRRRRGTEASPAELHFAIETDRIFRMPAIRLAETQLERRDRVYLYEFAWASSTMGGALGACHAIDLPFVFGQVANELGKLFTGGGRDAETLSEQVMNAWIAFAREGDPSHAGLAGGLWPRYTLDRRETMIFDDPCEVAVDPAAETRSVWQGLI